MAFKEGDLVTHENGTDMIVVQVFPPRSKGTVNLDGMRTVEHFNDVECTWTDKHGKSYYQKYDARQLKAR